MNVRFNLDLRFQSHQEDQILLCYNLHPSFFDAVEAQVLISKHILKTLCTDVTNILFNFLAGDLMMSAENPSTIGSEVTQSPH